MTRTARRAVVAAVALVVIGAVAIAVGVSVASSGHTKTRVALFGDSLSFEAKPYLAALLARNHDVEVQPFSYPGTAICDWLEQMRKTRDTFHPQVVAFEFVGNDILPCMRNPDGTQLSKPAYLAHWERSTRQAIALFPRSVRIDLIGAPTNRPRDDRVYDLWRTLVHDYPNAHFYDGGRLVSPHRTFVRTLPCLPGEPCTGPTVDGARQNVVRASDGTHFCPREVFGKPCSVYASGAYRFAVTEYEIITGDAGPSRALLPATTGAASAPVEPGNVLRSALPGSES